MGAKFKSKTHLLKRFLIFLAFFARLASKFEKKYQNDQQQKIILKRSYQRTQNFMLISNPLDKFLKNAPKKVISKTSLTSKSEKVHISAMFLLITFVCAFFQNFFNEFEIRVKFCVFYTHIEF
jgi:hypothetical protein